MPLKETAVSLSNRAKNFFRKRDQAGSQESQPPLVQQRNSRFLAVGQTHAGLVRPSNQDAFLIDADSGLFIVADGMGGHRGGEVASEMAVDITSRFLKKYSKELNGNTDPASDEDRKKVLEKIFEEANSAVYSASRKDPRLGGMGTTLIIAWMPGGKCHMAHVGDVRGYLFREGAFKQLTRDHSTVATLVESGHLTPEEALDHPLRHQIERAVGPFPQVELDVTAFETKKKDIILLCSDGLWDMVRDEEIASELGSRKSMKKACKTFMERALAAGGKDNTTLVMIDIL